MINHVSMPLLSAKYEGNSPKKWSDVNKIFGDEFYSLDGGRVNRNEKIKKNARLPAIFLGAPITGDLIPETSWGSSLSNLLTKKSWDGLRHPLILKNNNVCQMCGSKQESLDVHEIWSYHLPPKDVLEEAKSNNQSCFGVQKLEGLMAICKECHQCFHLGFAKIRGNLDRALNRLQHVNLWGNDTIDRYYADVSRRFEFLSNLRWALDFSVISGSGLTLIINGSWQTLKEEKRLLEEKKYGGITSILNCNWSFANDKGNVRHLTTEEFNRD